MALEAMFVEGHVSKHGRVNGKDNLFLQFINMGGPEGSAALLVKEALSNEDSTPSGVVKDTIYPLRNLFRVVVMRREPSRKEQP